jgi:hypothetical protein
MSNQSRRDFLKNLTLGGIAVFTDDWFKLVVETKLATGGKQLPALPGEKVDPKADQIRAFWNSAEGSFQLCLNGTIYDEAPEFDDDDYEYEEFDEDGFERDEDESDAEYEARREQAREEWDDDLYYERKKNERNHEFDWCRRSCPGAQAVPYLHDVLNALEEAGQTNGDDYSEVGAIEFYDGACPGNDTYVAATAPDYETLAALQCALNALEWNCRVVIVEPNPSDKV